MTQIEVIWQGTVKAVFTRVISSSLADSLSGECTFEFTVTAAMAQEIRSGYEVRLTGDRLDYRFNIARISMSMSGGIKVCSVICEHKSYELNDEIYDVTDMDFSGPVSTALSLLLEDTAFTPGECDITSPVELKINQRCTRRAALMQLAALSRGEIEYDGDRINILAHRGATEYIEVMDGKAVSDVTVTIDTRSGTSTFGLTLYKKLELSVGDNVHIVFHPYSLNEQTRIVSMTYNPYNPRKISIEVGDYFPSIADNLYKIEKAAGDIQNEINNISDSTAAMKIGINASETVLAGYRQDLFTIPYEAVKTTYAAFCTTAKFTVSTAGTITFLLYKGDTEVIRYREYYAVGEYARTYSYPFVSLKGLNVIAFAVLSDDGAMAVFPKMQTLGYVIGAYLAGDTPWDGRLYCMEEFTSVSVGIPLTVTAQYEYEVNLSLSENVSLSLACNFDHVGVQTPQLTVNSFNDEFALPVGVQYAYYIDSSHLGVKFANPIRESSIVITDFAAMGGVEGDLRSVEIIGISLEDNTLIIETAGFQEYDSDFLVGYTSGSLLCDLNGEAIPAFSLPFSKEDL